MLTKTLLQAALDYAANGWNVFPCQPNTKLPATKHGVLDATLDVQQITDWWTRMPTANIGVACGVLYVVDVDDPASAFPQRLPETLTSRTPRGGSHHVFFSEEQLPNTAKRIAPMVDTRGNGGYILVEPSVVDGKVYRWENNLSPAPLPQWIADLIKPKTITPQPMRPRVVADRTSKYGERALVWECDTLASTQEGGRNHALNTAAYKVATLVAGGEIDEQEARESLTMAAQSCGLPEKEAQRTIESAFRSGLRHPRNAPERIVTDPFNGEEIYDSTAIAIDEVRENTETRIRTTGDHDANQTKLLEKVMELGGLCETFPRWCLSGADYPQPNLTIAALLALGSAMGGRRLVYHRATTPAYICAIAGTATGKGRPQSCVTRVLRDHWSHVIGPSDLSSTASTIERLSQAIDTGVGLLFVLDEYGPRLKTLLDGKTGYQKDMRALLLQLATIGTGDYVAATSLARGGKDKTLQVPAMTIFGSSTPQALHDAIGRMALDDGFLGRHIFFDGLERIPHRQRTPNEDPVPNEIDGAVLAIRRNHERWVKSLPNVGTSDDGKPILMYFSEHARDGGGMDVLNDYIEECDNRRRDQSEQDHVPGALLGRAGEHAQRIALILALLSQPAEQSPTVDDSIARVAVALAHQSIECIAMSLEAHSAESDHERQRKRVIAALRSCGGPDGWVRRSQILRAARSIKSTDLTEILSRLADEGAIEARKLDSDGSKATTLIRLVAG